MLKIATLLLALAAPITAFADAKLPETVAEHQAMAKQYQDKAAEYRKEAAFHKEMADEYKKTIAPGGKSGPNPWAVKMEKHCRAIIADAEKMAADADKMAEFHAMRAKELQGK
jgi:hypothetical protein